MADIKDDFTEALKTRIQTDAPEQMPASGWQKIALGKFYPGVDAQSSRILINAALGTVLGEVLRSAHLCLNDDQLNQFFAGISTDTTPEGAIERMLLVGGMAVPC